MTWAGVLTAYRCLDAVPVELSVVAESNAQANFKTTTRLELWILPQPVRVIE